MKTMKLHENWVVSYDGKQCKATVPGDVTLDLYNNGVIENPYFGMNHKNLGWIIKTTLPIKRLLI